MKKVISLLAAVTIVFSGMGSLAVDASAVNITTAATAKATTTKSTTRTGKQLTYQQAYDRLKNLSFATGKAPDTTANTNTTKPATTTNNTNQNKPSGTTNQNNSASTAKNNASLMTDYKGKAISNEMYVFRNSLKAEEQEIYDLIKAAIDRGDTEIHFDKSYKEEELFKIFRAVYYDNPYMTWLRRTFSKAPFGKYKDKNTYKFSYIDQFNKDRKATIQLMDDYLKPVLDKASKLKTDVEKVKYIHDYIIYSTKFELAKEGQINIAGTPYSVIVNKKGVCEGYSRTFTYCLQKLGIVSICIRGIASNNEGSDFHMWNQVKLDGEWYVVDVLWDEVDNSVAVSTDYSYNYFLKTNDIFTGAYVRKMYMNGLTVPTPKGTKYSPSNYNYDYGSNFNDLPKVVLTKRSKNYKSATVNSYNAYAKKSPTKKSSTTKLPTGWYNYSKVLTKLNVKSLKESDWTKEGDFYFIEKMRNGKGTGQYVVYDVAYDNYYEWSNNGKYIMWFNYKKSAWLKLS